MEGNLGGFAEAKQVGDRAMLEHFLNKYSPQIQKESFDRALQRVYDHIVPHVEDIKKGYEEDIEALYAELQGTTRQANELLLELRSKGRAITEIGQNLSAIGAEMIKFTNDSKPIYKLQKKTGSSSKDDHDDNNDDDNQGIGVDVTTGAAADDTTGGLNNNGICMAEAAGLDNNGSQSNINDDSNTMTDVDAMDLKLRSSVEFFDGFSSAMLMTFAFLFGLVINPNYIICIIDDFGYNNGYSDFSIGRTMVVDYSWQNETSTMIFR